MALDWVLTGLYIHPTSQSGS